MRAGTFTTPRRMPVWQPIGLPLAGAGAMRDVSDANDFHRRFDSFCPRGYGDVMVNWPVTQPLKVPIKAYMDYEIVLGGWFAYYRDRYQELGPYWAM